MSKPSEDNGKISICKENQVFPTWLPAVRMFSILNDQKCCVSCTKMISASNMNSALCKIAIQIDILYCNSPIINSLTGQYQRSVEVNERFLGLSYSVAI